MAKSAEHLVMHTGGSDFRLTHAGVKALGGYEQGYRIMPNSPLVDELIKAAGEGKGKLNLKLQRLHHKAQLESKGLGDKMPSAFAKPKELPAGAPIIPQAPSFADQMAEQIKGFVAKGQALQKDVDAILLKETPFPVSRGSEMLMFELLDEHPNNPRQVFEKLEELAQQIEATHGLLIPMIVRSSPLKPGRYQIIAGARRFRALQLLKKKKSPYADKVLVDIRELTDAQVSEAFMTENDRENLKPLEEATGYQQMLDTGHTVDTIASTLGVSKGTVHGRLKLLELSPTAKKLFLGGALTTAIATPLGRYPKAMQDEAIEQMFSDKNRQGAGAGNLWRYGEYNERYSHNSSSPKRLNVGMAIAWLQEHFTKSLKTTAFDQEDPTIQVPDELWPDRPPNAGEATAPSCKSCPKNSNNMPQEIAGENAHGRSNAGFCTLPPCYDAKWDAALKKLRTEAKEKGDVKVLGVAQSRSALKKDQFGRENKYARLSEVNHRDPKKRTYGQLLDVANEGLEENEKIRKALAVSEDGRAQLVNREEIEKVLAAKGELPKPKAEPKGYDYQAQHRREEAKRTLRKKVSFELLGEYVQQLRDKGPTLPAVRGVLSELDNYDSQQLEQDVFGLKNERELDTFIEKKGTLNDLLALVYLRLCAGNVRSSYSGYDDEIERIAKELKVDLKKREKATVVTEADEADE